MEASVKPDYLKRASIIVFVLLILYASLYVISPTVRQLLPETDRCARWGLVSALQVLLCLGAIMALTRTGPVRGLLKPAAFRRTLA